MAGIEPKRDAYESVKYLLRDQVPHTSRIPGWCLELAGLWRKRPRSAISRGTSTGTMEHRGGYNHPDVPSCRREGPASGKPWGRWEVRAATERPAGRHTIPS